MNEGKDCGLGWFDFGGEVEMGDESGSASPESPSRKPIHAPSFEVSVCIKVNKDGTRNRVMAVAASTGAFSTGSLDQNQWQ